MPVRTKREWYRTSLQNKQDLLRTEGILGCLTKVPFILAGDANWSLRICTFIFKALCKHQPLHLHTIASREVNMYSSSIFCFLEVQRSTGHFYSLFRHKRELLTTPSFVGKWVSQGHGGNWWQNRVFWKDPAIQPGTESTLPNLQHTEATCRILAIHCFNVEGRLLRVTLHNLSCKRNSTCFLGTSPFAPPTKWWQG